MLRSIGSVTFLALLMVGCGGGGGTSGGGTGSASSPPPPPPINGYTVGGTVSGLAGSGLTLELCSGGRGHGIKCHNPLQVGANGAFTLDSVYPAGYSGGDAVSVTQQPSSPTQLCLVGNAFVNIQNANDTSVTVSCADYNEYSYVTNAADYTLSAYLVDATTGALSVVGTPIPTGASPYAVVRVDFGYGRRFVFVGNEDSNDVSAFAVNSATGALTAVLGSPFAAGKDPKAMAVMYNANGWLNLYVVNAGSDTVSAYIIDPNTGALGAAFTIATGKGPSSIAVDPNRQTIYVANNGGSNDVSVFSSYPTLRPVDGSPFPAGANPLSLTLEPTGNFLYTANPDATNPSISGFRLDVATGALTPLGGSPFLLAVGHDITDGMPGYLYVTTGAGVVGYGFDGMTGALFALPGFPVAAGANAYSITVDPTNRFLYVTDDGAATVSGFTLDASTGALTPMAGSPFPAGHHPEFITMF